MIKETTGQYQFIDAFRSSNTYKNNFSYEGLKALYDYLWDLSEDIGEDIELDVVAICCDYVEYNSAFECATDHGYNVDQLDAEIMDDEEQLEKDTLEWLEERTQVISFDDTYLLGNEIHGKKGIIVQSF